MFQTMENVFLDCTAGHDILNTQCMYEQIHAQVLRMLKYLMSIFKHDLSSLGKAFCNSY